MDDAKEKKRDGPNAYATNEEKWSWMSCPLFVKDYDAERR